MCMCVCICVCMHTSCQAEHLAACSQLADGGHKQSQVAGLSTIKISDRRCMCGIMRCVYVSMYRCSGKTKQKRIHVGGMDLFFREIGGDGWHYI